MRESDWYGIDICNNCERRLNNNEIVYSRGICPKCGYDNNGTVCKIRTVILKEIKHYPWWQLWNRKRTYIGNNNFSNAWLMRKV